MSFGCYYFNKDEQIDFKIPYYINFGAGDRDSYGLCLYNKDSKIGIEKIVFNAFVSSSINTIIEFESDSEDTKNSIYVNLKQGSNKYVLLNPNPKDARIKHIILYVPYVNNMALEETKIVISDFCLK